MSNLVLRVERLEHARDLPLPAYATNNSSGLDLAAAVDAEVVLQPGERLLVPTGLRMEIPDGYEGQVRPRSGLAIRSGISMVNTPGTIDADYRGEVQVIMVNLGHEPFIIKRGDRIAQLVIAPVARVQIQEAEHLSGTVRQEGGFGHTGA